MTHDAQRMNALERAARLPSASGGRDQRGVLLSMGTQGPRAASRDRGRGRGAVCRSLRAKYVPVGLGLPGFAFTGGRERLDGAGGASRVRAGREAVAASLVWGEVVVRTAALLVQERTSGAREASCFCFRAPYGLLSGSWRRARALYVPNMRH